MLDRLSIVTGAGMISDLAGSLAGPVMVPMLRRVGYRANMADPNMLPGVTELIYLAVRQAITPRQLAEGLAMLGITLDPGTDEGQLWRALIQHSYVRPGIEVALRARLMGLITDEQWIQLAVAMGADAQAWWFLRDAYRSHIPVGEVWMLRNRGLINDDQYRSMLAKAGPYSPEAVQLLETLRHQIPGPSDLIRFAVRESFSPTVVRAMRYDDEFPAAVRPWMAAHGLDYPIQITDPVTGERRQATWSELYWWSHWQPLAPTQVYEMYQRLRPGRPILQSIPGRQIPPFTREDAEMHLRVADYPPSVRDQLLAIAYHRFTFTEISRLVYYGWSDKQDTVERYRDFGYSPEDSVLAADMLHEEKDRRVRQPALEAIAYRYIDGEITRDDASAAMDAIIGEGRGAVPQRDTVLNWADRMIAAARYREREAFRRSARRRHAATISAMVTEGVIDDAAARQSLIDAGIDRRAAGAIVAGATMSRMLRLTRAAVRRIRADYLEGAIDETTAQQQLRQAGMTDQAAAQEVASWRLEMTRPRRALSTERVLRLYQDRIIDATEAAQRLARLGWSLPDVRLQIIDAELRAAERDARAAAARQRSARSAAKEQERLAAEAASQLRRFQADLRRSASLATIRRWVQRGIMSPQTAARRLALAGYAPDDVGRYLAELVDDADVDDLTEIAREATVGQSRIPMEAGSNGEAET